MLDGDVTRRDCAPDNEAEGCLDHAEIAKLMRGKAGKEVQEGERCICKGELCNDSPNTRTVSVVTIIVVATFRNHF